MKKAVILNNIGSPNGPDTHSVRVYLREFLMDPQVIELPYILRFILVYFIISLFRAPKSAEKYQKIWTEQGSPLVYLTNSIAEKIKKYKSNLAVETGMVFQNPSIQGALEKLIKDNPDLEELYFIPMYPQFSLATTDASVNKLRSVLKLLEKNGVKTPVTFVLKPFYDSDFFIDRIVEEICKFDLAHYECLLFSYHGLPTSSILKNPQCRLDSRCCDNGMKTNCYRSQCFATTNAVIQKLNLKLHLKLNPKLKPITAFQSRLGRGEWIQPYTDKILIDLVKQGITRILVVCPSFTVDCLETLEEIQIENKNLFISSGGQVFDYVPCLNDQTQWCHDLADVIDKGVYFDRL